MIRRLMVVLCVLMCVVLGAAACGDDGGDAKKSASTRTDSGAPPDLEPAYTYYTGSMVVIRQGETPRMCTGAYLSNPPQCGDLDARPEFLSVDVKKFDASKLTDRHEKSGTVWYNDVSITGHLDGTVLTATEPAEHANTSKDKYRDSTSSSKPVATYTGTSIIMRLGELPRMCKVVATSLPPQCGIPDARPKFFSVDVKNFDASKLKDRQEASGVVWYDNVSITGRLNGTVLTATEPAVSTGKPSK